MSAAPALSMAWSSSSDQGRGPWRHTQCSWCSAVTAASAFVLCSRVYTDGGAIYFYTSNKIFSNSNTTCGCEVSTWLASRGRQCWVEESSCGSSLANQRGGLGHVIRCGDLIGCQLLTWPRGAAGGRAARRPARRALCPPSRSPADKIILIEDKRSKVKTAF